MAAGVSNESHDPGLRARKRRATENAIELAAVSIASEQGLGAATIDAICRRADVSRSTFFNYFPSKEQAIFGRAVELDPRPEFDAILDAHAADLVFGVFLVGTAALGSQQVNTEVARLRGEIIAGDPALAHHYAAAVAHLESRLVVVLAGWLARHPEAQRLSGVDAGAEAVLTVGAATTAGRLMMAGFFAGEGDMAIDESAFRAAVAALGRIVAPA
ncbi:MAG: TetR family transcriptional regulator [Agromyces sp.]